ncbi:MAG: Rieske (2Fe-2S) protein [Alphaproteobacteria bacterium]|jgi:nitrite reductase/ring-hydroxylating ferredoxin subunit
MTEPTPLVALNEVPEDDARGITIRDGAKMRKFVVLRWQGETIVYRNRCPHAGTPLDWIPDRFFDRGHDYLFCTTHGASFEPASGLCIDGPCVGDVLERCTFDIRDGVVTLTEAL